MAEDYREEDIIVPLRCPNCGGLNPPENRVCQLCGYPLTDAIPAPPPSVQADGGSEPIDAPPSPLAAAVEPSAPASPPPARGSGLAARLGGAGNADAPATDWLGGLRRNISGEVTNVVNEPTPPSYPTTPPATLRPTSSEPPALPNHEPQVGYLAPPIPAASPYRRDDLPRPSSEPVDWLASLRASSNRNPEAEQSEEGEPVTIPDWLHNLHTNGGRGATSAPAEAEDDEQANMPPWLAGELAAERGLLERGDAAAEPAADLPPWLRGDTDMLDPAHYDEFEARPNPATGSQAPNIPPWMQQPPEAAPPARPDFSDWFSSRNTPSAEAEQTPPPTPPPSRSEGFIEDSDAPAWLREVAAAPPPPLPQAMTAPPPEPAAPAAEEEEQQPQFVASDEADEVEAEASAVPPAPLQPEVSDGKAGVDAAPQGAELAAEQSAAVASEAAPEVASEAAAETTTPAASQAAPPSTEPRPATSEGTISGAELPPWLRMVGGEGAATSSGDGARATAADASAASFFPTATGGTADRVVPDWLRGIGHEPEDVTPSSAEALTAAVAEPVQRIQRVMTVRPSRPGAAEALAALVAAPSASTRTSPLELKDERNYPASLVRWLLSERGIYLLTALVMVAVVLADRVGGVQPLGSVAPPAANAQVDSFYKAINTLPHDAPVLVAYDWDANRQAEMTPLARAVTCHLGAVNARFATVSLAPTGPAFAQQVAEATVDRANPCIARRYNYGSDYVNLGYSAGGDFALRSMVGSIATVFSNDYVNGSPLFGRNGVAALKNVTRLGDFRLIIVLEGDESTARSWVEQVASQPNTPPLLLGEPAALDPSLKPYLDLAAPTRFIGKVAGLADTARYQYDLTAKGMNMVQTDLSFSLNALSFAALLIALLIIIGNVVFITRLINNRK